MLQTMGASWVSVLWWHGWTGGVYVLDPPRAAAQVAMVDPMVNDGILNGTVYSMM